MVVLCSTRHTALVLRLHAAVHGASTRRALYLAPRSSAERRPGLWRQPCTATQHRWPRDAREEWGVGGHGLVGAGQSVCGVDG